MQKVKNYMNAYKSYAKSEREKFEVLKKDPMYSQEYIAEQEKKLNQALEAKRQEYLKGMNEVIVGKLAAIKKPDIRSVEYQTVVSNIFTKVQLIGKGLTSKILAEILEPAIEKQDNSTLEAVRSYIASLSEFPGGDIVKRELVQSIPRVINNADLLENARTEINRVFTDRDFGNGLKSEISMQMLEQSGAFEL